MTVQALYYTHCTENGLEEIRNKLKYQGLSYIKMRLKGYPKNTSPQRVILNKSP
jgi:hypothetical protein